MNTGPSLWACNAFSLGLASMMRRSTPGPASTTYKVPPATIPILVPDRSASIVGEPTPRTMAVVDADPFLIVSVWDRSELAELANKVDVSAKATASIENVKEQLDFIELLTFIRRAASSGHSTPNFIGA